MKNIALIIVLFTVLNGAFAQKYVPRIDAGTQMGYTISLNGEKIIFLLNVKSLGDSVKMSWEVSKYGSGTYVMAAKSLEDGNKMRLEAPEPDEVTKLPESETMAFISKAEFKSMTQNKVMDFDDMKYVLSKDETSVIKVDNRELDMIHAVSTDGKNEIWVLNNPDFPLICKTTSGALGADLTLNYIR